MTYSEELEDWRGKAVGNKNELNVGLRGGCGSRWNAGLGRSDR
jgi:hypothetical protein